MDFRIDWWWVSTAMGDGRQTGNFSVLAVSVFEWWR
jgi:hypothetical protein